jgi:L-serine deaminase
MRASKIFIEDLMDLKVFDKVEQLRVDLYGSLALTGVGHGTNNAILVGLEGDTPETVDTKSILPRVDEMYKSKRLKLNGTKEIMFCPEKHLIFHFTKSLPAHPNGMRFSGYDKNGDLVATNEFFSIGGGFVVNEQTQLAQNVFYKDQRVDHAVEVEHTKSSGKEAEILMKQTGASSETTSLPTRVESKYISVALPFDNAQSLLDICQNKNMTIAQVVFQNELQWRNAEDITARTLHIWDVMNASIQNGIHATQEYLPGGLRVKRRAPSLHKKLLKGLQEYAGVGNVLPQPIQKKPLTSISKSETPIRPQRSLPALDWISLYAIAVNEENAAGGRVVTAPTNGAAGTIPAVLKYYLDFICPSPKQAEHDIIEFLLTSAAIGMLYKRGASISAAEAGCQGEVGVACSMAAAAYTAVMGGTVEQVENAAEIAMEHNLGLTCDPPMGLVVIPCIERNALAAVKAVTASQLALNGDGTHRVSLDQVIATMRQTGLDMMSKYKETSQGGLAVNVPVC